MPNEWIGWEAAHTHSRRMNPPKGYIDYLRTQPRFRAGILDDFPPYGVVLHDTRVQEHLARIGVPSSQILPIRTGTTDPNLLLHVMDADKEKPGFILNRGLPGGGGISTQAAELAALGVRYMVHIGTCAYMGDDIPSKRVLVSRGSYKDGAAVLLSQPARDGAIDPFARPDPTLSQMLFDAMGSKPYPPIWSGGYTIASFYHQPESMIRALVLNENLPGDESVGHLEMEQASFFELGRRMEYAAASLVVGSDRYRVVDGELTHAFEEDFDQDAAEREMLRACIRVFRRLEDAAESQA